MKNLIKLEILEHREMDTVELMNRLAEYFQGTFRKIPKIPKTPKPYEPLTRDRSPTRPILKKQNTPITEKEQ